jgi:hypothetical protein
MQFGSCHLYADTDFHALQHLQPEMRTFMLVMMACNAAEQYQETSQTFATLLQKFKTPHVGAFNAVLLAHCM